MFKENITGVKILYIDGFFHEHANTLLFAQLKVNKVFLH